MGHSKRYLDSFSKVDRMTELELMDAVAKVRETATAKFDETVEVSVALGVDPRHADQMIRSTVTLPNGTGKVVRVLVLCKEDKAKEAEEAGADYVGLDDLAAKIQEGWSDFDAVLATPDVMPVVGRLGKILGPKGLMPNPKTGTVTNDIGDAVREIKGGRLAFRVDKYGILHVPVGKASFEQQKLYENVRTLLATIQRLKLASAKGQYWKSIALSSTMGPGIKVSRASVLAAIR